jgi:hypothetical protein
VALGIWVTGNHPAHGEAVAGPLVTVANTAANPVPATVTNTPNVKVANTPAVNAQQSGPWNVGINGTPNVNVANTPSVTLAGTPTVNVGSLPAVTLSGNISASPSRVSNFESINELGLSHGASQSYYFTREESAVTTFPSAEGYVGLDTTTLVISTANNLDNVALWFCLDAQCNIQSELILGQVNGPGFSTFVFNQPIRFLRVDVHNPATVTSATFTMTFLGSNLQ